MLLWSYPDTDKNPLALQTEHAANIFGVQFMPCTSNSQIITGSMDNTVMLHHIDRLPTKLSRTTTGSLTPIAFQSTLYGCHHARVKVCLRRLGFLLSNSCICPCTPHCSQFNACIASQSPHASTTWWCRCLYSIGAQCTCNFTVLLTLSNMGQLCMAYDTPHCFQSPSCFSSRCSAIGKRGTLPALL